jgi:hypothetical protein
LSQFLPLCYFFWFPQLFQVTPWKVSSFVSQVNKDPTSSGASPSLSAETSGIGAAAAAAAGSAVQVMEIKVQRSSGLRSL